MVKGRTKLYIEQWAGAVLFDGLLVTEQKTSPHSLSMQFSGELPAACLLLPAVLVVAQGMEIQSLVQAVSPTMGSPAGAEMEKLLMSSQAV